MNATSDTKIQQICSRVVLACEQFQLKRFSHKQWKESLEFAIREAYEVLHKPPPKDADNTDARYAQVQWAKDCRIVDWCHKHHILLRGKHPWRWIDSDEVGGMIWALPTLRGIPRVTNGILVYCERPDGTVFQGHMDWFIKDLIPTEKKQTKTNNNKPKKTEKKFDELFLD